MLIFFAIFFGIAAVICLFIAIEEASGWAFLWCICLGVLTATIIVSAMNPKDPPKKQKQPQTQTQTKDTAAEEDNSAASVDENESQASSNVADNSSSNKTDETMRDPKLKDFKEDSKDEWQTIAEKSVKKTRIVCDDGIQLKVIIWTSDDKSPDAMAVWPRLHQDGKPYSCSESKDPSKEVSL